MKRKTIQIHLPEELHEELKEESKKQGIFLNVFYERMLRLGLEEHKNFLDKTLQARRDGI